MDDELELDLAEMSGESSYRSARRLELNEVMINGDGDVKEINPGEFKRSGGYFRKRVLVGHKRNDGKPEEIDLGSEISVIFLKIRRKMQERGQKGEIVRSTSEHNHKNNVVTLFDSETKQSVAGKAIELRERYEGLRTVQVIYGLLLQGTQEPELVRLLIKGSSLGSEAKAKDVMDFYSYIASFGKDEHIWEYETVLEPVLEAGAKSYFAIKFSCGRKLESDMLRLAVDRLKEVYNNCVEVDADRDKRIAEMGVSTTPEEIQTAVDDALADTPAPAAEKKKVYDETLGEANPDDIPF